MTKPYQPSFSIQPTYGFRYMSQPFADNISSGYVPPKYPMPKEEPKVKPDYKPPQINNQALMDTSDSNDNQNAEISTQMSLDAAQSISPRDYDAEEKGVFGKGEVYGPSPTGLLGAVAPVGLGSFTGPAVPTSGYGSPGSVSSLTGGTFNEQGRSIDPITGYANPEFATSQAFTNYMLDDPLGNTFGDVDNQFSYSANNPDIENTNQAQGFEFAMENSPLGKDDDGMTQDDKNTIATKIGLDMGIDQSSLGPNSPTVDAIQGIGYSTTGAAPPGSQFSSTGIFSGSDSSGPDTSNPESTGSTGVSVSNTSYSDDAQSSGTGGGDSCCFIMLEARYGNGTMDDVVRRYRDEHMTIQNKRGYYKVASVLVPLMRKSKVFKWIIIKTFADPLVCYGKWYYKRNKYGWIFSPIKNFWLNLFETVGTDTKFIKENGEIV